MAVNTSPAAAICLLLFPPAPAPAPRERGPRRSNTSRASHSHCLTDGDGRRGGGPACLAMQGRIHGWMCGRCATGGDAGARSGLCDVWAGMLVWGCRQTPLGTRRTRIGTRCSGKYRDGETGSEEETEFRARNGADGVSVAQEAVARARCGSGRRGQSDSQALKEDRGRIGSTAGAVGAVSDDSGYLSAKGCIPGLLMPLTMSRYLVECLSFPALLQSCRK